MERDVDPPAALRSVGAQVIADSIRELAGKFAGAAGSPGPYVVSEPKGFDEDVLAEVRALLPENITMVRTTLRIVDSRI